MFFDVSFLVPPILAALAVGGVSLVWGQCFGAKVIHDHETGLLYRDGRLARTLGPGKHRYWRPGTDIFVEDTRARTLILPGQEVLTADGVGLKISLAATWRLADFVKARAGSVDYHGDLYLALQMTLRQAAQARALDDLLQGRDEISAAVLETVRPTAEALGLEVAQVGVRDVMLPAPLKRAYAAEIEARKEAASALERARGEQAVLRKLANLAKMAEDTPGLMELRTLQAFAGSQNVTVTLGGTGRA